MALKPGVWHKSTRSISGACVEVRTDNGVVQVRDTKNRDGGTLTFPPAIWQSFIDSAKDGEFDLA